MNQNHLCCHYTIPLHLRLSITQWLFSSRGGLEKNTYSLTSSCHSFPGKKRRWTTKAGKQKTSLHRPPEMGSAGRPHSSCLPSIPRIPLETRASQAVPRGLLGTRLSVKNTGEEVLWVDRLMEARNEENRRFSLLGRIPQGSLPLGVKCKRKVDSRVQNFCHVVSTFGLHLTL